MSTDAILKQVNPTDWDGKLSSGSAEAEYAAGVDDVVLAYTNTTGGTAFLLNASVVPFDEGSLSSEGWVNFYLQDSQNEVVTREYHNIGSGTDQTAKMSDSTPLPIESGATLFIRCYNLDSTDDFFFHASYTVLEPHA